ncbi:branched-chain amino acid ABC transporter permease [Aeromicrobium sp. PE09-221]|uniref:AzlC family ABC transporter permease n=1 Tax=Aeromicrobium sp. PE09-221 TaxID=1898043 RepID=UPI000B3E7565|nr:AzlC family ABC transporter permease [Aeromicrobium sp. PE09-221]OUZ07974.1 branched-chain amino acid ABC transporter permease [Aeromicrobium sp. PE09-221]
MSTASSDRAIITDSLGVGLATGAYGVSFGALATAAGMSIWQACAMSLLMFTGASQFAYVGVIASGGSPLAGAVTSVLLGGRNLFYGLSLARLLDVRGWRRPLAAQLVIDESTAMAVTRPTAHQARLAFYWTGGAVFVLWNLFTFLGALAGTAIGDPRDFGLDAAVGAAFLALLWPRLDSAITRGVAILAAAIALGLVPLSPAGVPIIVGGGLALLAGLLLQKRAGAHDD